MSQLMNAHHQQKINTNKQNQNYSNLSSLLYKSREEQNFGATIHLSKSCSSEPDARYLAETADIRYSGYLLKRSNQPYHPNGLTAAASIDFPLPPDLGSHSSESIWSSETLQATGPQQQKISRASNAKFKDVTKSNGKFNDHVINAIRFGASLFGYLPDNPTSSRRSADLSSQSSIEQPNPTRALPQRTKPSPIFTSTKSKPIPIVCPTPFVASNDSMLLKGNAMKYNQYDMSADYGNENNDDSFIASHQKKSPHHDDSISRPPDLHDLDGHIWRSKYCVLENGVLYFYCNAKDANSIAAQEERDKLNSFSNHFDDNCTSNGVVEKSYLKSEIDSDRSSFEVDHLAKSPMPRNHFSKYSTPRDKTNGIQNSNCLDSTNVLWEKRVALHRVGSVLASEDFGEESFILCGINSDADNAVENTQKLKKIRPGKTLDKKACSRESLLEDRLILRAASSDNMRNWIFEIHKSLQIIVNKIVRNKATSSAKKGSIHPHFASEGHSSHSKFDKCMSYSPTSLSNSSIRTTLSLELQRDLPNNHGRSVLLWQPIGNESNLLFPCLIPGKDSLLAPLTDGDLKIVYDGASSYTKHVNSGMASEPTETLKEMKTIQSRLNSNKVALSGEFKKPSLKYPKPKEVGKYIPPQMRGGKYVPPHRRQECADVGEPIESPSDKSIFRDKSDGIAYSHLESKNLKLNQLHTNDCTSLSLQSCNAEIDLPSSPCHNDDADTIINSSKRLGGCADPTLIEGSICDPVYIPKKASVVGKVNSKPYGSYGGISTGSGKAGKTDNIQWEVGAACKCGIRSSNEDAYLVLNDLFSDATTDQSASLFKGLQSHGIFAIFDGHCGNHTARYAAEKFQSILLNESMKDDFLTENENLMSNDLYIQRLLKNTLIRLDHDFCEMCTADGREWNSGATALVAMVIGNKLAVAGLGDSNGVLCCTTSRERGIQEDGWKILDEHRPNSCNRRHEANIIWKDIVQTHNPSREDERKRIEDANGWITTETEILCSQIQRVNWDDYDVIDLVGRSSCNGNAGVGRISTISRVCGDLAVSRALGDREFKAAYNTVRTEAATEVAVDGEVSWESDSILMKDRRFKGNLISSLPEINLFNLGRGKTDEFLLLACDGLWDVMDAIDAVRITHKLLFEKGLSTKDSADRLAELAHGLGSSDNITVIIVHFRA